MTIDFNHLLNMTDDILEINNIEYAPFSINNAYNSKTENILKVTNNWFKGRGIPSWRKDLEKLLERLNVSSSEQLLNKVYRLSISDQYWLKAFDDNNDFVYEAYLEASLDSSTSYKHLDPSVLKLPNNTTDGVLQKGRIIEDDKRKLIKGTYSFSREEPFNEWLSFNICNRLGFNYCYYQIEFNDKTKFISKCNF